MRSARDVVCSLRIVVFTNRLFVATVVIANDFESASRIPGLHHDHELEQEMRTGKRLHGYRYRLLAAEVGGLSISKSSMMAFS